MYIRFFLKVSNSQSMIKTKNWIIYQCVWLDKSHFINIQISMGNHLELNTVTRKHLWKQTLVFKDRPEKFKKKLLT